MLSETDCITFQISIKYIFFRTPKIVYQYVMSLKKVYLNGSNYIKLNYLLYDFLPPYWIICLS